MAYKLVIYCESDVEYYDDADDIESIEDDWYRLSGCLTKRYEVSDEEEM